METTTTRQEQARELLLTCADAIKNGSWLCGSISEKIDTNAPRNKKPPGCAVGLLGIWGDQLQITTKKIADDTWVIGAEELNPSEWHTGNKNYNVAVDALKALARAVVEIYKEDDNECWEDWNERSMITDTEDFVINYNDGTIDAKGAEEWFRSAVQYVR